MTNLFSDFRRLVVAALDDLARQGALPAGARFQPGRGRAAARSGAWRSRDQCRDGVGRTLKENPMALAERIAAALSGRELVTGDYRGSGFTVTAARPGFINVRLGPRGLARAAARDPARRHQLRRFGDRRSRTRQCRVRVHQPDRPDACGSRARRGGWRRAGVAAGQGRLQRRARVLHQRFRCPGRHPRPLDVSALPRGVGRGRRADPRGVLSRRISCRNRPRARRAGRQQMARPARAGVARTGPRFRRRADDGVDPGGSRGARCAPRFVRLGARACRKGGGRRVSRRAGAARADLHRGAGAARRANCPTIGSRGRRPCSAPPDSATTSTGRSRNRTARGLISPPTSPITATSFAAASRI